MEARKRLAIVASHLRPLTTTTASSASGLNTATASSDSCPARDEEADAADCVFCKIARRQSHAFVLYEDDVCLCIFDSNPLCPGHSLIIPRSHFSSLGTTPPSVVAAMCSKIPYLSDAIMKATSSDAFNLLVNNGAAAGQVIFHTHIHIIPRKTRDCLWASEIRSKFQPGTKPGLESIKRALAGNPKTGFWVNKQDSYEYKQLTVL